MFLSLILVYIYGYLILLLHLLNSISLKHGMFSRGDVTYQTDIKLIQTVLENSQETWLINQAYSMDIISFSKTYS